MKSLSLKSICYSSLFSFLVVFSLIQCSSDFNSEEEITSASPRPSSPRPSSPRPSPPPLPQ